MAYLGIFWGTTVSAQATFAHAELLDAIPSPGSSVESLSEIRLIFSEPIGSEANIQLLQDFVPAAQLVANG